LTFGPISTFSNLAPKKFIRIFREIRRNSGTFRNWVPDTAFKKEIKKANGVPGTKFGTLIIRLMKKNLATVCKNNVPHFRIGGRTIFK
jgi:hypothetical protein